MQYPQRRRGSRRGSMGNGLSGEPDGSDYYYSRHPDHATLKAEMGLRKTILLGLGPLLSLWAMTAHAATDTAARLGAGAPAPQLAVEPFDRLLHPVVSFLMLAAGHEASRTVRVSPSSLTLSLDALQSSAYRSSLWLVRGPLAIDLHSRRNHRSVQRC